MLQSIYSFDKKVISTYFLYNERHFYSISIAHVFYQVWIIPGFGYIALKIVFAEANNVLNKL